MRAQPACPECRRRKRRLRRQRGRALSAETVFLVNPASANGATGRKWAEIAHRAAVAGLRGETLMSQAPGQITDLARQAAEAGARRLVVVGGDGTVNEAVNGLLRADRASPPELAVLPSGTGRDFSRSQRIPGRLDRAIAVARDGVVRTIDAGRARYAAWDGSEQEMFFANIASAGLSGAVARRANATSKALGGKASFFWALVAVFARWQNTEITVGLADGERRSGVMTNVVVANGDYHGGGMWLCPEAKADDGLFDVLVIGDVTKADFVGNVAKIYRGTHLSHPKIELLRSAQVTVESPVDLPVELDGEQPGTTPVAFDIVPRALRVVAPV